MERGAAATHQALDGPTPVASRLNALLDAAGPNVTASVEEVRERAKELAAARRWTSTAVTSR
ncbi:hypothetical protein HDC93_006759 [Streptomyces sp. AK010]|nr:hypothetical protein [Streptomyces sp. AK010]